MAPRVAVLLVLLCATAASAAPTCPATASATSCYEGAASTSWPATGGVCTCTCGANAATASSSNTAANDGSDMMSAASNSAACTAASCATAWATECGSAAYKSATYKSYASYYPVTATPTNGAAICTAYNIVCTTTTANPCLPGLTSGSIAQYGSFGTVAECNLALADTPSPTVICNTNNCNAPPAASAAASSKPVMALAAAVGAAALAVYL
jgi:hypothetical protein